MNGPKIKICGIRTPDALDAAIKWRADYAGFVFFPPSPRNIDLPVARELGARARGRITTVGLFVEPDDALLTDVIGAAQIDVVQLHGQETPERAAQVKARTGLPVWKALSIASTSDVARAESYRDAVDMVLFDAKTPKGTLPGGMGLSFDWSLLSARPKALAWGLAGGLTPSNVAEAAAQTAAPLVDTSSGVESEPGVKNVDLIAAFCQAARQL